MKIGFIGLGNMAKAMIGGMIAKKMVTGEDVIGSAKTEATILAMRERYGIETTLDNGRVAMDSDVLFLAVKPQFFGAGYHFVVIIAERRAEKRYFPTRNLFYRVFRRSQFGFYLIAG